MDAQSERHDAHSTRTSCCRFFSEIQIQAKKELHVPSLNVDPCSSSWELQTTHIQHAQIPCELNDMAEATMHVLEMRHARSTRVFRTFSQLPQLVHRRLLLGLIAIARKLGHLYKTALLISSVRQGWRCAIFSQCCYSKFGYKSLHWNCGLSPASAWCGWCWCTCHIFKYSSVPAFARNDSGFWNTSTQVLSVCRFRWI